MNDRVKIALRGEFPHRQLIILIIMWGYGIFVFDLAIQLGYAGGVPYVLLVLLSFFSPQARFTYLTAVAASLLTLLGYFLSPPGGVLWVVLLNRALALVVIWITAILVNQYRSASIASKMAETALRESEAKLRTVTEKSLDAITMIDHEITVLYWNTAAEKLFGYQASEVIGRSMLSTIIPEKYHGVFREHVEALRRTGTEPLLGHTFETMVQRKNGTEFPMEHAFSASEISGKWISVGIMRDITKRKEEIETQFSKLNMEHQRIVQLEKLSAMGLMIGEIAHQINNPLVGVVNMAQLALREGKNPENTRELLEDIQNAGEDCRSFLQRMMEFTKVSCFDRKPTEMKSLIGEIMALCQQSATHALSMEAELPEQPVMLEVDPILIRHALFNLISNAFQADEKGKVTVRLSAESRDGEGGEGWALSVLDKGPGLSEEIIDKIFTPFFTTRSRGTGLGLSLVQHVAILHGGLITATNHPGGGAAFTLWLPDNLHETVHG